MASPDGMPDEYKCPITYETMRDPVFAADGHTYERAAISKWLETRQTSPLSNARLPHRTLVPNRALKTLIDSSFHVHTALQLKRQQPDDDKLVGVELGRSACHAVGRLSKLRTGSNLACPI